MQTTHNEELASARPQYIPDFDEARRFLGLLDPNTKEFTFQTFDDTGQKRPELAQIFHGTFDQHREKLARLNAQGAGVFVTVNMTDLKGRGANNVMVVRVYFGDTDGAPLKPILEAASAGGIRPFCIIESSPKKYHVYWRADCPLYDFKPVQKALAARFDTDPSVNDLPRVMRLAGFYHRKHEPVMVRIIKAIDDAPAYTPKQIIAGLGLELPQAKPAVQAINDDLSGGMKTQYPPPLETPEEIAWVRSMLGAIPCGEKGNRVRWREVIWAVASTRWSCAQELAREWSMSGGDLFSENVFISDWNSYKSDGGIGFGTLVHHAKQNGWVDPAPQTEERFTGSGGDVANGRIFASMFRNKLLFIHETDEVLAFDTLQGWASAQPGEADRAAKVVLDRLRDKAAEAYKTAPDDPKTKRLMSHVERTSRAGNLRAMPEMAKSEEGMTRRLSEFDNNPMMLGVANGVLDLRTAALLPVSPTLLVSKRCGVAYDAGAECPLFMRFFEVVQPEADMRQFIQKLAGYILTGGVGEQKLFFFYGAGANGKSVLIELLAWLLGEYAGKIATEMLMHQQRNSAGPSPDIVSLKGRRLVYANETEEGRRLAEARVKDFTGGDGLVGRVPYGKADINFQPTHKLIMLGNHRPEITDMSNGMWRRIALVPFDVTIPEADRDPHLLEKLKAEGSGILNWMLAGLRQYQRHGLKPPAKITGATAAYKNEMDIVGEWIDEQCDTGAGAAECKSKVYRAYHHWAESNGHRPMAQGKLTRRLGDRGYKQQSDKRTIGGLSLNAAGLSSAVRARLT
ncbi:MAG: phage/plasmid primase, P4 family [Nitrosomonadales bacterium]